MPDGAPRERDRSRPHDLVLMGATGFTGQLVAAYVVRHHLDALSKDGAPRLALAGRNRDKLERVRDDLARIDARASELALVVVDSDDADGLARMARDTEVVCTTVGPYARHGAPLVAACVEAGTDYCDLTGEPQFIRRMIDAHHERATQTGARIVHCCGFDSIPSDLGTLMVQTYASEKLGGPCEEIKFAFTGGKGGFSGGTIASMMQLLEEAAEDKQVRRTLGHPYGLNPEGEKKGPDGSDLKTVQYDADLKSWVAPFVMASVNTRVVRRSNALLGYEYGRDFRYGEVSATGDGVRGALRAGALTAGLGGFVALAAVGPTRKLLQRTVLPAPGQGPDQATREAGYFVARVVGLRPGGRSSVRLEGRVKGEQDPGYGETAKMLGESAVCLVLDGPSLTSGGGILTPATAMGTTLLERLRGAGMTFEVHEA